MSKKTKFISYFIRKTNDGNYKPTSLGLIFFAFIIFSSIIGGIENKLIEANNIPINSKDFIVFSDVVKLQDKYMAKHPDNEDLQFKAIEIISKKHGITKDDYYVILEKALKNNWIREVK